jgi:nitroreductase
LKVKKEAKMDILTAMATRRSVRAYHQTPVTRADIEAVVHYAGLAPSAINLQPWEYVAVYGEEKARLVRRLQKAHAERKVSCGPGTTAPLPDKFVRRSRAASQIMAPGVAELGLPFNRFIEEGSCAFYGAPVAIIVTIDTVFPKIRYLDLGLSIAYLLLAAEAKGLSTCPIGLITAYAADIAEVLNIPADKEIVLGIALGYADAAAPVNRFKTGRADQNEVLCWYE